MPDVRVLLRCVGEAVCANGLKALMGLVPMGGALFDIANDSLQRVREATQDDQIRALGGDPTDARLAALVASDRPPAIHQTAVVAAPVPAEPVPVVVKRVAPVLAPRIDRLTEFLDGTRSGVLASILDLGNRRIGSAGAAALAESPRLKELTTLLLTGCQIGDEGLRVLVRSPNLANLTRLELWDNHLTDEGVKALADCPFMTNLEFLDLGRNQIGNAGIEALAGSPHLAHLSELLIVSNEIGDEGALALASSPYLANLAWLKPLDNRLTAAGVDALKNAFGRRVRVL